MADEKGLYTVVGVVGEMTYSAALLAGQRLAEERGAALVKSGKPVTQRALVRLKATVLRADGTIAATVLP